MDIMTEKWKNVKFHHNDGHISSMTLLGDRIYVLSRAPSYSNEFTHYCTVTTCSLSALLESDSDSPQSPLVQSLVWNKLCPLSDLFRPSLANLGGNLVAVGGRKSVNAYADSDGRDCKQYSCSPALYAYSNEISRFDSEHWKFVSYLPDRSGYPNVEFLFATLQGDGLIVCGGDHIEYDSDSNSPSSFTTDLVHIGLFK